MMFSLFLFVSVSFVVVVVSKNIVSVCVRIAI